MECSILICDDSQMVRRHLRETFKTLGTSEIYEASNGVEAVELCRTYRPDVIIMDIIMPVKDGVQALKEIVRFDSNVKIIMASSAGTNSHLKKTIMLGAFATIQKPISDIIVRQLVQRALTELGEVSKNRV
ncbi:response regulator transcription factor [Alteribacter aurantiacus]|uniref:response regulator transcription factor n=1 Tax=Alteribacter aurantiacus TaxID=254410 RepID=UPI000415F95E|nr:response regulator [Alteribacter aurantiacus]